MKRLLFITSAIIIALTAAARQVVCIETGEIVSSDVSTKPIRNVEQLDNGVRVTYRFSHMVLDSISPESSALTIAFESFGTTVTPNYPALPARMDAIKIPADCDPTITVESAIYEDYFFELAPAPELELEGAEASSGDVKPILTHGFVPEQPALLNRTQQYKGHGLCFVNVVPVLYNHDDKAVRVAKEITYLVEYESLAPMARARSIEEPESCPELDNIALNSSVGEYDFNPSVDAVEIPRDYLIITIDGLRPALDQFVDWKKSLGFTVHVTSREKWEDDGVVKDSIAYYYSWFPNIDYIMILGNHNLVPGILSHNVNDHVTDYYYGLHDFGFNFDFLPQICRGRIPVASYNEAKSALDKVIAYELCENVISPDFFEKSLHCAVFHPDTSNKNQEERRFVWTSEEILDAARKNEITPIRVYKNAGGYTPLKYTSNGIYGGGRVPMNLPEELTAPDFNWNGSVNDISSAIKQGVGYILYRGHGQVNGWQYIGYLNDQIATDLYPAIPPLSNLYVDEYVHPVVFSVTCQTGMHTEPDCFARKMLTQRLGGASGVFAATNNSFSGPNDAFCLGAFNSMFTTGVESLFISSRHDLNPANNIHRAGMVLNHGLYKIAEKYIGLKESDYIPVDFQSQSKYAIPEYELLHYFGDPSMIINTKTPTSFSPIIDLDPTTNICRVNILGGESALIAFYDKNVDKVQCTYATNAEFQFSQIHYDYGPDEKKLTSYENVVIYAPNKIPFIKNKWGSNNSLDSFSFTQSTLNLTYTISTDVKAQIIITKATTGNMVLKVPLNPDQRSVSIDISTLKGAYIVSFVVNGQVYESKNLYLQ